MDEPWARGARSAWITLDASALAANARALRAVVAPARLGGVIKGDAYGHGLAALLPALHAVTDVLYAITAGEALAVRRWEAAAGAPRRELLVIGALTVEEVVALARADVAVVLGDVGLLQAAPALREAGLVAAIHVHVDSGLGREGLSPDDLRAALGGGALARVADAMRVEGVLTHFADTEDVTEQAYAHYQLARFEHGARALAEILAEEGLPPVRVRHVAASAAGLVLPQSRMDVVRAGIALYGLWPSRETRISARQVLGALPTLRPVLSWRVRSQLVKTLPAGSDVGYGCTHRCLRDTRVAVLPVGYFDGYPRALGNRAHVLVRGHRAPVIGRVMMNHVLCDVSGVPGLADGDEIEAVLLGQDGDETVTADMIAAWADTIAYEIVARLPAHLRREVRGALPESVPTPA